MEPVIRAAIAARLPDPRFGEARSLGSWWTRAHDVEIDLIGVPEPARRVTLVGSIKWRDRAAFDETDARALVRAGASVAGVDDATLLVGVSRAGFSTARMDVTLGPDDILAAWRT